ncbi:MAG: sugar phosphorylase [Acidimicrobiales bacterium]
MRDRVRSHLDVIYPDHDTAALAEACIVAIGAGITAAQPDQDGESSQPWDEADAVCITYGDSLVRADEHPLLTLGKFANERLTGAVSALHVLPFFPSSSDFGFSVIDFHAIDPRLGDWDDITALAEDFDLMVDLILNHTSAKSPWFQQFLADELPGSKFFIEADVDADYSAVVRPRAQPLLSKVDTAAGPKHVWCTFSPDQVDVDFSNPDVLVEYLRILDRYLNAGARLLRLDAVAFIWKELGTKCIHLPKTHEIVKLFRTLLAVRSPRTVLITETNVPNHENLSYFGDGDEAHTIYNFSLPPMVVHTLLTGSADALSEWVESVPPAPQGCTYLNFLASHDGLGVRPVEQILTTSQIDNLVDAAHHRGGSHSLYSTESGDRPYELNVSLFDLLSGLPGQESSHSVERFVCAHAIMFALEGIPALYIHSLLGTSNDHDAVSRTGIDRAINRANLSYEAVGVELDQPESVRAQVFDKLTALLRLRREQPAFHPHATQSTLDLSDTLFGVLRQSEDRNQSLFAICNVTDQPQMLSLTNLNLATAENCRELVADKELDTEARSLQLAPYGIAWISNR